MHSSAALVAMVKTPGLSPIKTRLAEGIDGAAAEWFYRLAVAAIEHTMAAAVDAATPYWAVAEQSGLSDPLWGRFARIEQGDGGLGDRLDRVIGGLLKRHDKVVVIGGDSPQLTPQELQRAVAAMGGESGGADFVLGPTLDGGFYLYGARRAVPANIWRSIEYGTPTVARELADALANYGVLQALPLRTDVDRIADLAALEAELRQLERPSSQQLDLLRWIAVTVSGRTSS